MFQKLLQTGKCVTSICLPVLCVASYSCTRTRQNQASKLHITHTHFSHFLSFLLLRTMRTSLRPFLALLNFLSHAALCLHYGTPFDKIVMLRRSRRNVRGEKVRVAMNIRWKNMRRNNVRAGLEREAMGNLMEKEMQSCDGVRKGRKQLVISYLFLMTVGH